MAVQQGRLCVVCGYVLSVYNTTDQCFRHEEADDGRHDFRTHLSPMSSFSRGKNITPEVILAKVAEAYGLTPEEILGRGMRHCVVWARQVVMYLVRKDLGLTYGAIATALSVKNPVSARFGCSKVQEALEDSEDLRRAVSTIQASYKEGL